MAIKIGNLDISAFKVGSDDCKVYLGDTLLYSGGTTPQTSCTPTSQILTTFDDIFDTTNPIYAINLEELSILAPYCENGYASVYFSLYDASGNTVLYVQASSSVDSGDEVTILDTNNNVVYSSTTLNTISICSLFGSPLYLDNIINPTYNIPTVQTCEMQECTEYDCMEYDEETGECIQEGDCIMYECTSWLDNYAVKVQI